MTSSAEPAAAPGRLDRIFRAALLLVPFGVLANLALSWFATDRDVLRSLPGRPPGYLLLAVALALVPWLTNALRLWIWTQFISHRLRLAEAFRITVGAELASSVLPTSSGSEVVRWGMLVQRGVTPGQAASVATLGYLEDLIFFGTALPVAFVLSRAWELPVLRVIGGQAQGNALLVLGSVAAATLALRLATGMALGGGMGRRARRWSRRRAGRLRRRSRRAVRDFRGVLRLVRERGKTRFLLTLLLTAVQWSCRYSVVTALVAWLGADTQPLLFFLLQWVIFTALVFVPTPGGAGGAEAAFLLVFSALLPAGLVGVATAGWRVLTFYLQLSLGAVLFAAMNTAERRRGAGG